MDLKITRRRFLKLSGSGVFAGLAGLGYSTAIEPNTVSMEHVTVKVPRLHSALEGFRIAVLSDFHLEPYTKLPHIQSAIRVANSLRPDLVVLLGDFVDSTVDAIHELAPAFQGFNARHGVFAVLGNHDFWKGASLVQNALQHVGIPVLRNRGVSVANGPAELFLAGVDSAWAGRPDVPAALANHRDGLPVILLAHEPDFAKTASNDPRISLQLSGHSHGGQVRLPFIGALELPSWGRIYDQGLYRVRNMDLYTNRGIGLVGVPVRFNCPPEVTEVTLAAG